MLHFSNKNDPFDLNTYDLMLLGRYLYSLVGETEKNCNQRRVKVVIFCTKTEAGRFDCFFCDSEAAELSSSVVFASATAEAGRFDCFFGDSEADELSSSDVFVGDTATLLMSSSVLISESF